MAPRANFIDRQLARVGLVRISRQRAMMSSFAGAQVSRLMTDFMPGMLSADKIAQGSLTLLRLRSRQLVRDNEYARGIVELIKKNVIGPGGITMQVQLDQDELNESEGELADQTAKEIERAWGGWCRRGYCTVDGRFSWIDVLNLAVGSYLTDGEVFLRKVKGFRGNPYRFALQFIDPDRVDATLNRPRRVLGDRVENEIALGVEVDEDRRPVAYHILEGHPSDGGAGKTIPVPAEEIYHIFQPWQLNQTRGVPLFAAALQRMYMLGQYENAELVASRIAASMMGFFVTKTGEDAAPAQVNQTTGKLELSLEAGVFEQLPQGQELQTFNPQHPHNNFPEFVKRMLQAVLRPFGVSYATGTGDLREVNFSSIRQGVLEERDSYRVLQTLFAEHCCQPTFEDWFDLALMAKQIRMPLPPTAEGYEQIFRSIVWMPRGWTWVDPLKDVNAALAELGGGMTTLAAKCAEKGLDWRDVIRQQGREKRFAKTEGVELSWVQQPVAPDPQEQPSSNQSRRTA